MGSYPEAFPVSGCCRNDVFWVHNLKLSLGRMRAVSSRGTSINGTPSSSQATVLKDFPSGLQIRPRRFDSGFGLHIRKPRRLTSAGFFYGCEKGGMCSAFLAGVPHVWFWVVANVVLIWFRCLVFVEEGGARSSLASSFVGGRMVDFILSNSWSFSLGQISIKAT